MAPPHPSFILTTTAAPRKHSKLMPDSSKCRQTSLHPRRPPANAPLKRIPQAVTASKPTPPASISQQTTQTVDETLLSPMLQQYVQTRRHLQQTLCDKSNRQLLLLYRVGDFFESFFEDAALLSSVCGIMLTSKEAGKAFGERAPMAGVPHHCVDDKIRMLVAQHISVCVVDQLQSAAQTPAGKLVQRAVTRLVTPAIGGEELTGDPSRSHYTACVTIAASPSTSPAHTPTLLEFGLAFCDVSTGEFHATDGGDLLHLQNLLSLLTPRELVISAEGRSAAAIELITQLAEAVPIPVVSVRPALKPRTAERILTAFHHVDDVESLGCRNRGLCTRAAGALIDFLQAAFSVLDVPTAPPLQGLTTFLESDFVQIDQSALKHLEVLVSERDGLKDRSLQWAVDRTVSPMGARRLRSWLLRPSRRLAVVQARLDVVDALRGDVVALRRQLKNLADFERLAGRLETGRISPREVRWLAESLLLLPEVCSALAEKVRAAGLSADSPEVDIVRWESDLDDYRELFVLAQEVCDGLVDPAPSSLISELAIRGALGRELVNLSAVRIFKSGFHPRLDTLRDGLDRPDDWISPVEQTEQERSGIDALRIKFVKNIGYVLRVPRSQGERRLLEDGAYFSRLGYERVQSTKAEMRFSFPDLRERARGQQSALSEVLLLERELFAKLCERLVGFVPFLRALGERISCVDVLAGFAVVADEWGYVRPTVVEAEGRVVDVCAGRHAVVEQLLPVERSFVANDLRLGGWDSRQEFGNLMLLCGPNAAGKSCALRSLGLMYILAQCGCFVPAEHAMLSLVDRIFTRVGAVDDVARGQSTFQVEMAETACILSHATSESLVLLDEIGRGTSTADGIAIAWSVAEHLSQRGEQAPRTLFVTHFHELNHLAVLYEDVRAFHMGMDALEGEADDGLVSKRWVCTHVIEEGPSFESMGLALAERAGFPAEVMKRAWEIGAILRNPCKALGAELRQALVGVAKNTDGDDGDDYGADCEAGGEARWSEENTFQSGYEQGYEQALKDMKDKMMSLGSTSGRRSDQVR